MTKNVTLRMDVRTIHRCRRAAAGEDKSFSRWVSDLLCRAVQKNSRRATANSKIVRRMDRGLPLGGRPLGRDEVHEAR
jgi:hypothetical protein